jgi:hypothetical protein
MRAVLDYTLGCKNRDSYLGLHEIRIPSPRLFGTAPNPLVTAEDIPAANVACPHCRHVYEYTRDDVRRHLFQIQDRDPVPSEPISFVAEFVCDEPDCKAPVLVHTMRDEPENRISVLERLSESMFHTSCMNGHAVYFPIDASAIVRAEDEVPFNPF